MKKKENRAPASGAGRGEMKERPILFSGPMVRAILADRKTETRRVVKRGTVGRLMNADQKAWPYDIQGRALPCPYGRPGDRLWVREKFQPLWDNEFSADWETGKGYAISYPATDGIQEYNDMLNDERLTTACKPSIHMPRWASRITLEITAVRVERVRAITVGAAIREGCHKGHPLADGGVSWVSEFAELWDSINEKRGYSWESNPWVWVVEFKRVEA